MATFDAKRLSTTDRVVVLTALVALIALFLPWYGASTSSVAGGFSASVSGFSTSYGWLGGLLIVAAGIYLLLHRSQVEMPSLGAGPAVLVLGASVVGTVIVILRWVSLPRGHVGVAGVASFSYGPRVGIWLTLIVGVVQLVCALSLFRASGEKLPWSQ